MARPSNFVFGVAIHLENIYVPVQFQGHKAKVKVTAAKKNDREQVCASLGYSLINFVAVTL